jgi:elongation factor Ts
MAAEISAQLVRELRERTGVGMMDCKRALQETNGDMEAAVVLLREKGMAQAAKRAGRATTEGLVGYRLAEDQSRGTMVAVGCETEPVAKSDEFQAFGKKVLDLVEADGIEAPSQLEEERVELSAKLGENIAVAGAARFARARARRRRRPRAQARDAHRGLEPAVGRTRGRPRGVDRNRA